ncbi:hypothetical protein FPRO04_09674 [Fusarium proliferatum]|nr:hypothetical protein FPRO03_06837 [Fusarium proliferatum]KAG4273551.1 hypothetical protein FPRO04_09674 [Fusarium proliferatum]
MAIQRPVARDDQFQAYAIGHQFRRDVTPEECYQCESAYQYVRQMQRNEKLCAGDAFFDLYSICVGCIEENINTGSPRDYVQRNLGRYVDYCAQFTSLTKWASMGATSTTSATLQTRSTATASAKETNGGGADETSITGRTRKPLETSIPASTANTIPHMTTEITQSVESASSSNISKEGSSGSNKAWIAGAVVPSVLVVALAVGFAIWWRKRRGRTPKTPKSPHLYDLAGAAGFDKPELDSQGIPRPGSNEEPITSKSTAVHDTAIFPVPAGMSENGLNRAELQGEAKSGTGQTHGSGAYYELPANGTTVYELSTKLS